MVVAVAMPMILQAAAWESTAGKFGWMIMTQTGARAEGLSGLWFFPRSDRLRLDSWTCWELRVGRAGNLVRFGSSANACSKQKARMDLGPDFKLGGRVQLPLVSPWIISSLVATALLAMTEMTVVDLYGFRTVADEFYLFLRGRSFPVFNLPHLRTCH